MRAVVLVELESGERVELTLVRRRVDRTERGPGLVKLEPHVIETDGVTVAEVIPFRKAVAK